MTAPVGREVGLFYDGWVDDLDAGDALRTPTGRVYLITAARRQQRGKHVGRWHLRAVVADQVPNDVRVFPLHWYRRRRSA